MRPTPALALSWQLWARQRWTAVVIAIYAFALSAACRQSFAPDWQNTLLLAATPLAFGMIFLLATFAYPEGDVLGRESSFPPDQFLLPVPSSRLVFWPVLYGALTAATAWVVFRELILRPLGAPAPVLWPAVMAAAAVVALQALLWTPMAVPYLRVVLTLALIPGILTAGIQAHLRGVSPYTLSAVFSAVILVAYAAAVGGLNRSRHGESPAWRTPVFPGLRRGAKPLGAIAMRAFAGTGRAQIWFEWRTGGVILPLVTAVLLALISLPFLWVRDLAPLEPSAPAGSFGGIQVNLWLKLQVGILFLPPMLAAIIGFGRRAYHTGRGDSSLHPFLATRPLEAIGFASARILAAGLATLTTWLIVAAFSFSWLLLPARDGDRTGPLLLLLAAHSPPATSVSLALTLVFLAAWTWRGLTQGMWLDVSGYTLLIRAVPLVSFAGLLAVALWLVQDGVAPGESEPQYRALSPWVLNVLWTAVSLKLVGLFAAAVMLLRARIVTPSRLALLTGCWLLGAAATFAALRWIADTGGGSSPLASLLTLTYLPLCSEAAPAQLHSTGFLAGVSVLL